MLRYFILFLSISAMGCAQSENMISPDQQTFANVPTIIFVPGYYGSNLRELNGGPRVFVTAREILFGRRALSLFQKELNTPPGPEVEADGILESVSVIPGMYSVDIYGGVLRRLAHASNVQVIPFSYDWRRDLIDTAGRLQDLIGRLKKSGVKDIRIVAHSMGGMVTLYSLAYGHQAPASPTLDWRGAEGVRAVAFLGVPFGGVLSPFRNMYRGVALSFNKNYFPPGTVASFPACYQLTQFTGSILRAPDGHLVAFDMEDPKTWREKNASLYQSFAQQSPAIQEARVKFVDEQVKRAVEFSRALRLNGGAPPPTSLKLMNVVGKGRRVMTSFFERKGDPHNPFIFDVDEPNKLGFNEELLYSDGDSTVSTTSAAAPGRLASQGMKTYYTSFAHDALFNDPPIRAALDQFLKE